MIIIYFSLAIFLPGQPAKMERTEVPSMEECVARVAKFMFDDGRNLPLDGVLRLTCEIRKEPLL